MNLIKTGLTLLLGMTLSLSVKAQTNASTTSQDNDSADSVAEDFAMHELGILSLINSEDSVKEVMESYMAPEDVKDLTGYLEKEGVKPSEIPMNLVPMKDAQFEYQGNIVKITNDFGVNFGGQIIHREPGQSSADFWKSLYKHTLALKVKKSASTAAHSFLHYLLPDAYALTAMQQAWIDLADGTHELGDGASKLAKGAREGIVSGASAAGSYVKDKAIAAGTYVKDGAVSLATQAYVGLGIKSDIDVAREHLHNWLKEDSKVGVKYGQFTCGAKGAYLYNFNLKAKGGKVTKAASVKKPEWMAAHYKTVVKKAAPCTADLAKKYTDVHDKWVAKNERTQPQGKPGQAAKRAPASTDEK
jgi:X-X-X-Leu-X-X-Gly heptad repeat protein